MRCVAGLLVLAITASAKLRLELVHELDNEFNLDAFDISDINTIKGKIKLGYGDTNCRDYAIVSDMGPLLLTEDEYRTAKTQIEYNENSK